MDTIDVIVVDDSAVSRRALKQAVAEDPALEIVATAHNGSHALEKLASVSVDAVVLDLHMPVMDGMEFLRALRESDRELPVVIVSSRTREGAPATINALLEGADACIAKPDAATDGRQTDLSEIGDELSSRLRSIVEAARGEGPGDEGDESGGLPPPESAEFPAVPASAPIPEPEPAEADETGEPSRIDAIGIAVSTGGPAALMAALEPLPADFPVPILITQHMPAAFTASLAERFDSDLHVDVREGRDGVPIEEATVWIAPGDRHMSVERRGGEVRLAITDGPKVNSCRPSADVLFESLAEVYGGHTLGLVMTGMGKDGIEGGRAIDDAGGRIVVQDEESAVAWGMPRASLEAGIVDRVVSLGQLGTMLRRIVEADRESREHPT